jgi:TatD DNase family protein
LVKIIDGFLENEAVMKLIDSHAHIYLTEFEADRAEMMERAKKSGIDTILMPAIDSSTHNAMMEMEKAWPGCHSMIGLHPCSVNQDFEKEIDVIEGLLKQRSFIAIGEIGLDFYWDKTFTEQQYLAFHKQLELAVRYALPVSIHSRNATRECIDVVKQHPGITGVFHCFSGTIEEANEIIGLGFYLGIGGVVTFKNSGLDKVVAAVGIDHVILETDAPYLAPVPFRGKRNEPWYLKYVVEKMAGVTGIGPEQVAETTNRNTERLFGLAEG